MKKESQPRQAAAHAHLNNRKGIELSFGWIFSIIVGGAILFLALYAVSQLSDTERRVQQTLSAQELVTRLTEVTTSLEKTSLPGNLTFATPTRITPRCVLQGSGVQEVLVAYRSGIGEPWQENGIPARSSSLYLFSATPTEGRTFSMIVKPLLLPFKVGDSISLWSGNYCFVQPSGAVAEDLGLLENAGNPIKSVNRVAECPKNSTSVCFAAAGNIAGSKNDCAIIVDVIARTVEKQRRVVSYIDPLIYAAIFSEPELYECNVQRILRQAAFMARVYEEKSVYIASRSQNACSSALQPELHAYAALAQNGSSRTLDALWKSAIVLDTRNPDACPLWKEELG